MWQSEGNCMSKASIDELTANDYKQAFLALHPLGDHEIALLKAHFSAPDFTTTASELAAAVGYPNWSSANLHYGKLAGRVCEELGYDLPLKLHILVTDYRPEGGHWHLVLRAQVVEALRELGWFGPSAGVRPNGPVS